jgi:hypothetical protein
MHEPVWFFVDPGGAVSASKCLRLTGQAERTDCFRESQVRLAVTEILPAGMAVTIPPLPWLTFAPPFSSLANGPKSRRHL